MKLANKFLLLLTITTSLGIVTASAQTYPSSDRSGRNNDRYGRNADRRLTGTFRLNTSQSDNINDVIDRSIENGQVGDRTRLRNNLERRLTAPDQLAIETRGNSVTMATNLSAPVTFQADGRATTDTNPRGRTTTTTATFDRNTLTINTEGERANSFWVSITPIGNNQIRMTRRLYLENQNETISATSVYDRTASVARWPIVDRRPGYNDNNNATTGNFYIPNGTRLTATLRNRIASDVSQPGDVFTLEVTSPSQYRGAIIEGRISEAENSGRVSGRANISLDFDTIRFRNRSYSFAGIIDSATELDGDRININNEGTIRDGNQTTRTATRAGIGAALGAVIGAIAGGGSGAAIGAGVGAGAGAGSVLIQGRDKLDLEEGSQFAITATGPTQTGLYRNR